MLERKHPLPGYTGHIPAGLLEEDTYENRGPRAHIPNYKGFIPGVKAENMFGKTYGKISEDSALGQFHRGIDIPPADKYKTLASDSYTNQMRIPVMPFKKKEYSAPAPDPLQGVPTESLFAFFGLINRTSGGQQVQAGEAHGPSGDLNQAMAQFFDTEQGGDEVLPRLTYGQARELANKFSL